MTADTDIAEPVFPLGYVIHLRGQRYVGIRFEPYTTVAGDDITLMIFQSHCPDCDALFEDKRSIRMLIRDQESGAKPVRFNRRCGGCANPLAPVAGRRKRRWATRKG